MSDKRSGKHHKLPKETPAFFCGLCGAVSLSADSICRPERKGTRADWCGGKPHASPKACVNGQHKMRFLCVKCGQVSINPELLCRPVEVS
jgi:predicted RNA-binding Zn-ribbon protein involved in translation (DUF1610 family)